MVKQIGKVLGIKVTKSTVAKGVSQAIPLIGGVISGGMNFASMMPMANRLQSAFESANFNYTEEEFENDIYIIENVDVNEVTEEEKDFEEIKNEWANEKDFNVHLTIDRPQDGWDGHVGFVPAYVKELNLNAADTVLLCGPPIMIKFTLAALIELGFNKTQVFTTMELRMKCGIGKCGRCNIGDKYVCKDGPVFRCDQLDEMPAEY